MANCWHCKKRIWWWQMNALGRHRDCLQQACLELLNKPPLFPGMPNAVANHRQIVIAEMRQIRDALPWLDLQVPLR